MNKIVVKCDECQKEHSFNSSAFLFESVDSDEREMGTETTYEASIEIECDCGKAIQITHRFWEYPEGMENYKETDLSGCEIVSNTL